MASHPTNISYFDAAKIFSDKDVHDDIVESSASIAHSMAALIDQWDAVGKQFHSFDLQGLKVPFKPRWYSMLQDFAQLLWQFRVNAGLLSNRLKIFYSTVLPLMVRRVKEEPNRLRSEQLQVLQSFANISSDHAGITRSLVDQALKFSNSLASFHLELSKFASQRMVSGQNETQSLSHRISELDSDVRIVCYQNRDLVTADVAHLVNAVSRLVSFSGRKPRRTKLSTQRSVWNKDLVMLKVGYDQLDRKQNEVVHAHYAAQIHSRGCTLITTLTNLVCDDIRTLESSLSLFLAIWNRLRIDCTDILQWIGNHSSQSNMPPVVGLYMNGGRTLYSTLAVSLDAYIAQIDPSRIQNLKT